MPRKKSSNLQAAQLSSPFTVKQLRISSKDAAKRISKVVIVNQENSLLSEVISILNKEKFKEIQYTDDISFRPYPSNFYDLHLCQRYLSMANIEFQLKNPALPLTYRLAKLDANGKSLLDDSIISKGFFSTITKWVEDGFDMDFAVVSETLIWLSWLDDPINVLKERDLMEPLVSKILLLLKNKPKDPKVRAF